MSDPTEHGLSAAQVAALRHVRASGRRQRGSAVDRITAVLHRAGLPDHDVSAMVQAAVWHPIALNLHPDRLAGDGRVVAQAILRDGLYRSQFETGISAGGLTAFPGGDRDRWEQQLFGGAYQAADVAPSQRPKYGGLNLMGHPDGPCPRFGSCHLRLRRHVADRATYSYGDSHTGPRDVGTRDAFEPVLAALLEAVEADGAALGRPLRVGDLVALLGQRDSRRAATATSPHRPEAPPATTAQGRALDDYIEVQVHGPVRLPDDVEGIVADPSFHGTAIGRLLQDIAARHDLAMDWHPGFELDAADVPAEFRGPDIPVLARRIARQFGEGSTTLHAERLGRAARSVVTTPHRWHDWGSPAVTVQHIKQLWHVLVRYGRPAA